MPDGTDRQTDEGTSNRCFKLIAGRGRHRMAVGRLLSLVLYFHNIGVAPRESLWIYSRRERQTDGRTKLRRTRDRGFTYTARASAETHAGLSVLPSGESL